MDVRKTAETAKAASRELAVAETGRKNKALLAMAGLLEARKSEVIQANEADMAAAKEKGIAGSLYNRLAFGEARIDGRVRSLRKIAALPDPVGQTIRSGLRPNGLQATRVRIPLGVILMIYESRPHATVNAGAFCLKSGNAALLKGGPEAMQCNSLLGKMWREALAEAGLPEECIQVIHTTFEETYELLEMNDLVDLVIPRGGKGLITAVNQRARIPVIKHFQGICHVYVDGAADHEKALSIALDSKLLMPAVCNASETLLVSKELNEWLPFLLNALKDNGIEVRGCPEVLKVMPDAVPATEENWRTEYLDTIYSVRVVDDVEAAIDHVNTYGSGHTDTIVTESYTNARKWTQGVDSSVVLVNASTMYCDGESLGMGAEIGISTDKLHARGPMGLEELTSYKHVIFGSGQVMGSPEEWKRAGA